MAPIDDAAPINSGDRVRYDGDEYNVVDRVQGSNGGLLVLAPDPSDADNPVPGVGVLVYEGAVRAHADLLDRLTPEQRQQRRADLEAELAALDDDDGEQIDGPTDAAGSETAGVSDGGANWTGQPPAPGQVI